MNEVLTAERVEEVFADSLGAEGVTVEGVVSSAVFDEDRLQAHRESIAAMLSQLPDEFKKSVGGGWSFLQACDDRNGRQWTGMHRTMEHLFQLGMGIGLVECQLPRDLWPVLPGGVPYYVVNQ